MITMNKYLVTIEFRYNDAPRYDGENERYITKVITIGVFNTIEEANSSGNKALEVFENYFKLNPHWNRKERFSSNGGYRGQNDLITNLTYLETPFSFYAKITELKHDDLVESISAAIEACARFKKYRESEQE